MHLVAKKIIQKVGMKRARKAVLVGIIVIILCVISTRRGGKEAFQTSSPCPNMPAGVLGTYTIKGSYPRPNTSIDDALSADPLKQGEIVMWYLPYDGVSSVQYRSMYPIMIHKLTKEGCNVIQPILDLREKYPNQQIKLIVRGIATPDYFEILFPNSCLKFDSSYCKEHTITNGQDIAIWQNVYQGQMEPTIGATVQFCYSVASIGPPPLPPLTPPPTPPPESTPTITESAPPATPTSTVTSPAASAALESTEWYLKKEVVIPVTVTVTIMVISILFRK